MRNTGRCPKCGEEELLFVPGNVEGYGVGNNIRAGATIFSAVLVHRYVCCRCGYSEEWVNVADIPKLQKRYRKK